MQHPAQENAMTEIALALAMGFFSLMVLTLISMGAGRGPEGRPAVLALAPHAEKPDAAGPTSKTANDLILIYDRGRYLDTNLSPVDPETAIRAMRKPGGRVILALDPTLPLKQAMKARAGIKAPGLVVSTLDDRWIAALNTNRGGAR